jgi:hydrogenase/urease accessory protein HupE
MTAYVSMISRTLILLTIAVMPAHAHSPIKGIGAFYNGLVHPILEPSHFLALLAIGLLVGRQEVNVRRIALAAIVAGIVVFLFAAMLLAKSGFAIGPILAALVAAILVALSIRLNVYLAAIIALAGAALVGLDSVQNSFTGRQFYISGAGTAIGVVLLAVYAGGMSALMEKPLQKIAVRIAGSWIAAITILALAFEIQRMGEST